MTETLQVLIDINQAGIDDDPELLEQQALNLADEIREVALESRLARESEVPEGSKGVGAFLQGILFAEVTWANARTVLEFLGNRFPGRLKEIEYEEDGARYKLVYQTQKDLEQQLQTIERLRLSKIKVNIINPR